MIGYSLRFSQTGGRQRNALLLDGQVLAVRLCNGHGQKGSGCEKHSQMAALLDLAVLHVT